MSQDLVSVVIPTFNRRELVIETVRSVLAQSHEALEVIVVDDGSSDGTAESLARMVNDSRLTILHQSNAGQAAARNKGLAVARGELVAFLDSDDLWPGDYLAWAVAILQARPDVEVVGGTVTTNLEAMAVTVETGPRQEIDEEAIFWGCPFRSPGQVIMRTRAVRDLGGFDVENRGVEDYDLYVRLACRRPIIRTERIALQYREHSGGYSRDLSKMLIAGGLCLRRRLPDVPWRRRWAMSRRAYRGLYEYIGREVLLSLKRRGWGSSALDEGAWVDLVRELLPGLLTDPRLAGRFMRDLIAGRQGSGHRL